MLALALLVACGDSDDATTPTSGGRPAVTPPAPPADHEPPTGDGTGGVRLVELGRFTQPVFVAQPPGNKRDLFVVEQTGAIRVIRGGKLEPEPFLDIADEISLSYEQGLLSMAFAPDYARTGRFYVDYTDTAGDDRVVEYRRSAADPLRADPESARPVLSVDDPYINHNGGLLLFGPDRRLYIGLGDGGSGGDPERRGQDLGTLLGKILRIDPREQGGDPYTVPADNPFVGRPGARPEIYSYGLRNPWRFSFDRGTGALSIGDVGESKFEEVDYVAPGRGAGANFGWSAFEGTARLNTDQQAPGAVRPVLTYGRDEGCSVTGGYVVRDRALRSLYGRYLYADLCAGRLRSFVPSPEGARDDSALGIEVRQPTTFAEDSRGRIYVASLEGPVYRLDPPG